MNSLGLVIWIIWNTGIIINAVNIRLIIRASSTCGGVIVAIITDVIHLAQIIGVANHLLLTE